MPPTNTSPPEPKSLSELFATVRGLGPRTVAVVQPCDRFSLASALEARAKGLVMPILVGEQKRILETAASAALDVDGVGIVDASDDSEAAATAVRLARAGGVEIVMKGYIHTADFLRPVIDPESGLRTDRRMSHVFVCYFPERIYPKPLMVTDAAFNTAPTLETKRSIIENAVELAHSLGIAEPKVAVLAAVETLSPDMPATADAFALRDMGRDGAFKGAIVDGPFAFDNAISREAARTKGIDSPVAGDADILLVPNIEAGNILYKQSVYFCGAIAPGIVLGATVPLVLTSRADPLHARVASCALAAAYAAYRRGLVEQKT